MDDELSEEEVQAAIKLMRDRKLTIELSALEALALAGAADGWRQLGLLTGEHFGTDPIRAEGDLVSGAAKLREAIERTR